MRGCLFGASLVLGVTIGSSAWADDPTFHPTQIATACANPRATLALSNPSEPRRTDPRWVAFVLNDGRCTKLGPDAHLHVIGQSETLAQIVDPVGSGQTLYIQSAILRADDLPAAVSPSRQWEAVGRDSGPNATCDLSGQSDSGTLTMTAQADHPGAVRVFLSKSAWHFPSGTPVQASALFSDGKVLALSGTGQGDIAVFEFRNDSLRPWVHEFTAAKSATIRFAFGSESPWQLDLRRPRALAAKF